MPDISDAHTELPGLAGRRVVVTGGTTGIGRAIAILLASEGAQVFVCGRDPDHLRDALDDIRDAGQGARQGDGMTVDLATRAEAERFLDTAEQALGGIDIAVINAAVPAKGLLDASDEDLDYQVAVDFTSYLTTTRGAAKRMQAGGDIVLIGSMSADARAGGNSIYVAAKSGIQGFAHSLRQELADRDIKVGLIEPGFTGADFQLPDYPPARQREMIDEETMLRAEDIAVATHFMLTQPRRTAVSLIRVEPRRRRG